MSFSPGSTQTYHKVSIDLNTPLNLAQFSDHGIDILMEIIEVILTEKTSIMYTPKKEG